jgi:AraC-like DNA-binding protein
MLFSVVVLMHSEISYQGRFSTHTSLTNIIIYIVVLCQYVFYLVYILKVIRNFNDKAYNELSNTEYINPAWLRVFLFTFLAILVLLMLMMIIAIHKLDATYFNNIVSLVFAFAIYVLGYKGLFQQTILPVSITPPVIDDTRGKIEHAETKVDEQLLKRLLDYMIEQKPWHDPELTLTLLASQINIGRNQLSEIINSGTGGNFYDFVNKYRVDEVKQLMVNPKYKDFTILAIAYEAGFPSKSTFNSIFKKFTGLTPSGYRNRLL